MSKGERLAKLHCDASSCGCYTVFSPLDGGYDCVIDSKACSLRHHPFFYGEPNELAAKEWGLPMEPPDGQV